MGPVNLEAEQAVLGAMLVAPKTIAGVVDVLGPEDFYASDHANVFRAILDVAERSAPDVVSVTAEMRRTGKLSKPLLVRDLADACPTPASARHYAEIVRDEALKRRLEKVGHEIAGLVSANGRRPAEMLEIAENLLGAVERPQTEVIGIEAIADEAAAEIDEAAQRRPAIATRLPWLDKVLDGGLHGGRLYVLGARPSVGKSALVTNIVRHALDTGHAVLFLSLEMSGPEVLGRLLADRFNFDTRDRGELVRRLGDADIAEWDLRLMEYGTIASLTTQARSLRPDLVVIDYVQLLTSDARYERRDLEVAAYTRKLKLLAKELRIPVVALSQVNRGPEGRMDRRPRMSDLRESGALEADPDVVMILHRDVDANSTEAELAVWKNRQGPTGAMKLVFQAARTRFREAEVGR